MNPEETEPSAQLWTLAIIVLPLLFGISVIYVFSASGPLPAGDQHFTYVSYVAALLFGISAVVTFSSHALSTFTKVILGAACIALFLFAFLSAMVLSIRWS
jgi:hypothetical protein